MITVTFYSYKGGVGRTLALANLAQHLVKKGKKVCMIDFDLEAPGLHYKFSDELKNNFEFKNGLLDYIDYFTTNNKIPENLYDYVSTIKFSSEARFSIDFIPAGNTHKSDYWVKLNNLDLKKLFLNENKEGVLLFLDLKERIKKELNPEFLLIDSRTGITEIFGISISLLADKVVVIAANNEENLQGAKMIINCISNPEIHFSKKVPDIIYVISRLPYPEKTEENYEKNIVNKIKEEITFLNEDKITILHSDRELEIKESRKITSYPVPKYPITFDYEKLFKILFNEVFTEKESKAYKFFINALNAETNQEQIKLYTNIINLKPDFAEAYINRGIGYRKSGDYNKAIQDYSKVIEIKPDYAEAYNNRGIAYDDSGDYNKAIQDYSKVIEIKPDYAEAYINRGNAYNKSGDYDKAIQDYSKAIEIKPDFAEAYINRGIAYYKLGVYDKAIQDYSKAIEIKPDYADAYINRGIGYRKSGDYNKAI
ncbi:MAG: tetratricopeptide repeat protein, partial [Bacteroidia bacterium]|nr:tetratricopeptide repeat protein [Bacteroidia bacterium]